MAIAISDLEKTFYVPYFQVFVADEKLPADVVKDLIQVTYKDSVQDIDGFDLTINNWDAGKAKFKYEPPSSPDFKGIFDPGKKLDLWMGYQDDSELMVSGVITRLDLNYPEGGNPAIAVSGLNVLHSFRTEQHTYSWENKSDSDIAEELGRKPRKQGQPGLGIKVETNPGDETTQTFVMMDNQYDIVFLLQRARLHDYELVLREGADGKPQSLYFGPSEDRGQPTSYKLEWGKTLSSFKPTINTSQQVADVRVRGWDRRTNQAIDETVSWSDVYKKPGPEKDLIERFSSTFADRHEVIANHPVHTRQEAKDVARQRLRSKFKTMVEAQVSCVGLTGIRAGRRVEIAGLSDLLNGEYYVTESTHTIASGYRVNFNARRDIPD